MQYLQNMANSAKFWMVKILQHPYSTLVENTGIFNVNAVNTANGIQFAIRSKCILYNNLCCCARSSIG